MKIKALFDKVFSIFEKAKVETKVEVPLYIGRIWILYNCQNKSTTLVFSDTKPAGMSGLLISVLPEPFVGEDKKAAFDEASLHLRRLSNGDQIPKKLITNIQIQ